LIDIRKNGLRIGSYFELKPDERLLPFLLVYSTLNTGCSMELGYHGRRCFPRALLGDD
jgi:hypothetical protein